MKYIKLNLLSLLILCLASCNTKPDCKKILSEIESNLESGNIGMVRELADSVRMLCSGNSNLIRKADSLSQIAERVGIDFSLDSNEIISKLETRMRPVSMTDIDDW